MPKIKSGPYEVFWSGVVVSFKDNPIEFLLTDEPNPLTISFHFKNRKEKPEQALEVAPATDRALNIFCYNFNNPLGIGNTEPIEIGVLANRKLFLYYRIYTLGETTEKEMHFAWYLGEGVANG